MRCGECRDDSDGRMRDNDESLQETMAMIQGGYSDRTRGNHNEMSVRADLS